MNERRQPGVIGSLPSTRPHRRSGKRSPASAGEPATSGAARAGASESDAEPAKGSAKPVRGAAGTPRAPRAAPKPKSSRTTTTPRAKAKPSAPKRPTPATPSPPEPASTPGALQTAVEAAVELTEIGLRFGAQALRAALARLPRP